MQPEREAEVKYRLGTQWLTTGTAFEIDRIGMDYRYLFWCACTDIPSCAEGEDDAQTCIGGRGRASSSETKQN
jgi:hypothetical protein